MKITNIEYQKDGNRVNIFIDNKFAFGLTDELRFKYSLNINDIIDEDFIDKILKSEEQMKVTSYALNLLSYRQRSEKEILDALKRKGYKDVFIEHTIHYLKTNNYIDDVSFSTSFIRDKINLNGYGSKRIGYELYNKGVSKEIIESCLEIDSEDEYNKALLLGSKKINSYKEENRNTTYRKLGGYLQRKGYSYDIVSKVLRELLKD